MLFAILVSNYSCISNAYWFPLEITAVFIARLFDFLAVLIGNTLSTNQYDI